MSSLKENLCVFGRAKTLAPSAVCATLRPHTKCHLQCLSVLLITESLRLSASALKNNTSYQPLFEPRALLKINQLKLCVLSFIFCTNHEIFVPTFG